MTTLGLTVVDGSNLTAEQSFEVGLQCLLGGISILIAQR